MRGALILVAITMSLVLGIGIGSAANSPDARGAFDVSDQIRIREQFPGGRFVNGDTVYELCDHGFKVRFYSDGGKDYLQRPCWK